MPSDAETAQKRPQSRWTSLDILRGMTIAAMIVVNHPGSWENGFSQLEHADWHGWTATDLVFPFFLFIVGASIQLSIARRRHGQHTPAAIIGHSLRRGATLILLGLLLNAWFLHSLHGFSFHSLRYPGVLQRIGLVVILATPALLYLRRRGRLILVLALLLGYWAAMTLIPVPGFGAGNLSREGNLAFYLDRQLFYGHMWLKEGDPEGLLSTFPAMGTAILGALLSEWVSALNPRVKTIRLTAAGVLLAVAGLSWGAYFPINKNLWTSSYVLLTAGLASILLGLITLLADQHGWQRWARPFVHLGSNALIIYFVSEFLAITFLRPLNRLLYHRWIEPLGTPQIASLLWSLLYLMPFFVAAWWMHRKAVFIRI